MGGPGPAALDAHGDHAPVVVHRWPTGVGVEQHDVHRAETKLRYVSRVGQLDDSHGPSKFGDEGVGQGLAYGALAEDHETRRRQACQPVGRARPVGSLGQHREGGRG